MPLTVATDRPAVSADARDGRDGRPDVERGPARCAGRTASALAGPAWAMVRWFARLASSASRGPGIPRPWPVEGA